MRSLIALCILLFSTALLDAQTRRMAAPHTGRTYTGIDLSSTAWPLLQKAEREISALNFDAAFFTFENVVAQYPNSAEALIFRAKFKTLIGMTTEADLDFQLARRINPYVSDLYGYSDNRGVLNLLAYEPENAILQLSSFQKLNYYYDFLDKSIQANELSKEASQLLGELIEQIEQDDLDKATESVSNLLTQYPVTAFAYDLKGLIFAKQNQPEAAIEAFSKAIEIDPKHALAWYNLGVVKYQLADFTAAKKSLDTAIALEGDLTKAYFVRAEVLKAMGDKESALADYNTIIDQKGAIYPEALLNRGLTKKMIGSYASALTDFNKVMEEFPNDAGLHKNRGNLYLLLGLVPKAVDDYTKAIQLNGEDADAYYNRSIAYLLLLDHISGCADLETSIAKGHLKAKDMLEYVCPN